MRRRMLIVLIVSIAIAGVLSSLSGGRVLAWHGSSGGATGTGSAALGGSAFSKALAPWLPGRGYRTCLIGNFRGIDPDFTLPFPPPPVPPLNQGHDAVHHWKYLSRVSGTVTLVLTVQSFNTTGDPGKTMTLTADHALGTSGVTVIYPPVAGPAGAVSGFLTVPVAAGAAYDLDVTAQAPGSPNPADANALHYRLGVLGPAASNVEFGYGHPTLEYQEAELQRWAVNAAPGETVNITISVDDTSTPLPGAPPQATTVTYSVGDPVAGPPPVVGPTTSPVSFGSPVPISFTNGSSGIRTYFLRVEANGHYKLDRSIAPDHGFYALGCPDDQGGIARIDIKPGSFPNSINLGDRGTVAVAIFSRPDFDATTVDPSTVTLAGAPVKVKSNGTLMASQEDVNDDGLVDLVVHVETSALQLSEGDTVAILQGRTYFGMPVVGADSVRIVP